MKTLFSVARCILHNINREGEREMTYQSDPRIWIWPDFTVLQKTPWDNPKQNKSLLLGGCWVQSLLFPMRLTNRCLSQIQVEDVFPHWSMLHPGKFYMEPQKCRFGRWMKMMFLWKMFGGFLRQKTAVHFQGVKTVHLEIFPTHELGDDHAKPSHHPPTIVQLDGMIFKSFWKPLNCFVNHRFFRGYNRLVFKKGVLLWKSFPKCQAAGKGYHTMRHHRQHVPSILLQRLLCNGSRWFQVWNKIKYTKNNNVYNPRTQMTLVFIGKGLVLGGWPSKIEVIEVLGLNMNGRMNGCKGIWRKKFI